MNKPTPIDEVLQTMERSHRSTLEEQLTGFSASITEAKNAFKSFAEYDEDDPIHQNSLLSMVESEQKVGMDLDARLREVKENLAQMERKRMLALAAMTRLSEDEAIKSLSKIKEEILFLALRSPLRADFIVYGQNITLMLFKLYENVSKTLDDITLLIQAKANLDRSTQLQIDESKRQAQANHTQKDTVQSQQGTVQSQLLPPQQSTIQPQQGMHQPQQGTVPQQGMHQPQQGTVPQQGMHQPQQGMVQSLEQNHVQQATLRPQEKNSPSVRSGSFQSQKTLKELEEDEEVMPLVLPQDLEPQNTSPEAQPTQAQKNIYPAQTQPIPTEVQPISTQAQSMQSIASRAQGNQSHPNQVNRTTQPPSNQSLYPPSEYSSTVQSNPRQAQVNPRGYQPNLSPTTNQNQSIRPKTNYISGNYSTSIIPPQTNQASQAMSPNIPLVSNARLQATYAHRKPQSSAFVNEENTQDASSLLPKKDS